MKFTRSIIPCLLTMGIVSYCGGLSQSATRWSPYLEVNFESVHPTEMRSEFGLLGCILNIDSPENCLAECSVRFIYIQRSGTWLDFRRWTSCGFWRWCILNFDSPENRLVECSVRFIYIQHRVALSWLFGDRRDVCSDGLRGVCSRLYFQGGNREFVKTICWCYCRRNWKWLQPLTTAVVRRWWESRLTLPVHNRGQCWHCRDEFVVC